MFILIHIIIPFRYLGTHLLPLGPFLLLYAAHCTALKLALAFGHSCPRENPPFRMEFKHASHLLLIQFYYRRKPELKFIYTG
jgi:hypothetical protein